MFFCGLICILLQVNYDSYQDTVDKPIDPDPAASDMFEYLTGNSTSLDTNGNIISNVLSVIQNEMS